MASQVTSSGPAQSGSSTAPQASVAQQTGSAPPAGSVVTRAATSKARFETPILSDTGDNYNNWAWTMKLLLGNHGLLSIVNGKTPAPDVTTDPNAYNNWYQRNQEALLQIVMALKSEGQNCINGVKSSKECWDHLTELYEGEGDQRIIYLMETLFITPLTDLDPMQPQLVALTQTAQQLVTAGLPVDDKLLAYLLVLRLPPSYATLRTVLSNTERTKITSKGIITQILAKERQRVRAAGGDVTVYYANAKAKAKRGKQLNTLSTMPNVGSSMSTASNGKKCSYCRKLGHEKSKCRKLKAKEKEREDEKAKNSDTKGSTPSTSPTAKVAVASQSSSKDNTVHLFRALAIPTSLSTPSHERVFKTQEKLTAKELADQWIIDSGASRNMCSHRAWFHNFSPLVPPINVILGDDSSILAMGVGCLSTRMYANGTTKPVVLQDILYVPDLHGNLLSVLHFAQRGTEMRFVDDGCRILDQRKDTVCEGNLRGNLYIMHMSTIIPESAHMAILNNFPAEGDETPDTALIADTSASRALIDTWH